jgi:hypothetical protein
MGLIVRQHYGKSPEQEHRQVGARIGLKHYLSQKKDLSLIIFMIIKILEDYCMQILSKLFRIATIRQGRQLIQEPNKLLLKH